jgi:predicted membrane-bound spermidine synthase
MGSLLAGFLLVARYGLPGTVLAASVLNITVAVVAWGVEKRMGSGHAMGSSPDGEAGPLRREDASLDAWTAKIDRGFLWRLLLGVSFGTAVASFIYEIAWIRMLSLVLGTATHSFELMLSAFILGLALGSFWMRKRADQIADPVRVLGWIQWIMGAAALATLPLYLASFGWTGDLLSAVNRTPSGYTIFNLARYAAPEPRYL